MKRIDLANAFLFTVALLVFESALWWAVALINNIEIVPKPTVGYFILSIPFQFIAVCVLMWGYEVLNDR